MRNLKKILGVVGVLGALILGGVNLGVCEAAGEWTGTWTGNWSSSVTPSTGSFNANIVQEISTLNGSIKFSGYTSDFQKYMSEYLQKYISESIPGIPENILAAYISMLQSMSYDYDMIDEELKGTVTPNETVFGAINDMIVFKGTLNGTSLATGKYYTYALSPKIVNGQIVPNELELVAVDNGTWIANKSGTSILQYGTLSINSIPSGAKIYLDGVDIGQVTNRTFTNILAGTHTIKLTLSGYQDWHGTATVIAGSSIYVSATLTPTPATTGSLTITSTPSGAKIYFDGTDTGSVTAHTFTNIPTGSHAIKLTLSGYNNWSGTTTVTAGSTTYVFATLTPTPATTGSLTIISIPPSAKIYLDDIDTGSVTTHTFTNISSGTHTIKLTLSNYLDWYGTATVIAGLTTNVYATLNLQQHQYQPTP